MLVAAADAPEQVNIYGLVTDYKADRFTFNAVEKLSGLSESAITIHPYYLHFALLMTACRSAFPPLTPLTLHSVWGLDDRGLVITDSIS